MVRKKRDHKAEYARRKARAKSAGYKSVNEYSKARQALKLPPRTSPIPKRILTASRPDVAADLAEGPLTRLRREAAFWSRHHSNVESSKYHKSFSNQQVRDYHNAFVNRHSYLSRRKSARHKRERIRDYLIMYTDMSEKEWEQKYELQAVS